MKKYSVYLLVNSLTTRIQHGFQSADDAHRFAQEYPEDLLDYSVIEDNR